MLRADWCEGLYRCNIVLMLVGEEAGGSGEVARRSRCFFKEKEMFIVLFVLLQDVSV